MQSVSTNPAFASYFDATTAAQLQFVSDVISDTPYTADAMDAALGLPAGTAGNIFAANSVSSMSVSDFAAALLGSGAPLDAATTASLQGLIALKSTASSGAPLDSASAAGLLGMDAGTMRFLYTYKAAQASDIANWRMSVQDAVNFIADNGGTFSSMLSSGQLSSITRLREIINRTINSRDFCPLDISQALGMDYIDAASIFLLYRSQHNNTDDWLASPHALVSFAATSVLTNTKYSGKFDSEQANQLKAAKTLMDGVVNGSYYSAEEMGSLLSELSGKVGQSQVELLYLYNAGKTLSRSFWTMSIEELFDYITGDALEDERFTSVFDDDTRAELLSMGDDMDNAVAQLKGEKYSRLIITTDYPEESAETSAFMERLDALRDKYLKNVSYNVGNSVMVHEMEGSFSAEYLWITLLTAAVIFLVVAVTFRSFIIPLILVLLVQCGVYITVAVIGLQGNRVYYLALLIVQSILMGATIDYAIVLTNYYRESRRTMNVMDSLTAAYKGTINTILTSGSILILVTAVLGFLTEQITSEVLSTISLGALSAVLLILFILPGILALFDKLIVGKSGYVE